MQLLHHDAASLRGKLAHYLNNDERYKVVFEYTKKCFNEATHLTAHNWAHTYRDILNAIVIGEAEGANMSVVLPAITMHDIGFLYGADGPSHGDVGAKKVAEFVFRAGARYGSEDIAQIANCIRTHKGAIHDKSPEGLEAKVVADADLLEKFGPFGVYQTIRTYGEFNWPIAKAIKRGDDILTVTLETKTGQALAEPGRQFTSDFYKALAEAASPYQEEVER